jgi:hypothetical protein
MKQREIHVRVPKKAARPSLERDVFNRFGLTVSGVFPTDEQRVIRLVYTCPYETESERERYDAFLTWLTRRRPGELSFPLALHEVAPGDGFARMPLPHLEGVHTGGPFVSPDGDEVWKPLDGLPYPNAPRRIPTLEDVALALMAGVVCFPRNWRVELVNGRRWLVRKLARLIPETGGATVSTRAQVLQIEQALRLFNARYWEIGDHLKIAIDAETAEPFILDLSSAHPMGSPTSSGLYKADDTRHFEAWAAEVAGFDDLVQLRRTARMVVSRAAWILGKYGRTHRWVYGSRLHHQDGLWAEADIPGAVFLPVERELSGMHTWVAVPGQLSGEHIARYPLEWAWGPIEYEKEGATKEER